MPICLQLSELQRVRLMCITAQGRSNRSAEQMLATALGFPPEATTVERKAVFKQAQEARLAIEAGDADDVVIPAHAVLPKSLLVPLVMNGAIGRAGFDQLRENVEARMRDLAKSLPVFSWVKEYAKGIGDLGLARLVGEAPLIGRYHTKERLWKRLGVAVINGERQQRKTNKEDGIEHGYKPPRRAELFSVCSDTMFRQQWRGGGEQGPGYPIGAYGEVYRLRKLHTLIRIAETDDLPFTSRNKWTPKRCDLDARRVMSKAFLEDLWRVWRGQEALYPARWQPPQAMQEAAE